MALISIPLPRSLLAQSGDVFKGFRLNSPRGMILGVEARMQTNGLWLFKQARIEDYLKDKRTNLVALAPECLADAKAKVAFSSGPLEVETASGQLTIRGQGFFYQQTNVLLIISNQVDTTIHRELIRSTNIGAIPFPLSSTTNAPLKIYADHFVLESDSDQAVYTGHVRVEDPQMELTCDTLTLRRSTNGTLENIVADQHVVVLGRADQSRATGERAIYALAPEQEVVILTGSPAEWEDRERWGRAGKFTYDRRANTLRANQQPRMKLPRASVSQPQWLPGKAEAPLDPAALTNQFVEFRAEEMLLNLPTTNQLSRHLVAHSQVEILSPADQSRASSDEAVYDEATGVAELSGRAIWQAGQRVVKGDTLVFERSNRVFQARGGAYLKGPLASLGRAMLPGASTNELRGPETVEVFCDHLIYEPAALTFYERVRANYLRGAELNGWLTCGFLRMGLVSNRVENVLARGRVALEQPATGTNLARRVTRRLNCEQLAIDFNTNGTARSALAVTNVVAEQVEARQNRALPIHSQLSAARASILFFPNTNQVKELVAERDVSMAQGDQSAHGEKAVYTATNDTVELTGHPTIRTPMMRMTQAEVLIWDRARNSIRARGSKVIGEGEVPGRGTNRFQLKLPK